MLSQDKLPQLSVIHSEVSDLAPSTTDGRRTAEHGHESVFSHKAVDIRGNHLTSESLGVTLNSDSDSGSDIALQERRWFLPGAVWFFPLSWCTIYLNVTLRTHPSDDE